MPYKTNKDLPENVTNVLPGHAQDIYREAFNHVLGISIQTQKNAKVTIH